MTLEEPQETATDLGGGTGTAQTSGPPVDIDGADAALATFTAPTGARDYWTPRLTGGQRVLDLEISILASSEWAAGFCW